MFDIDPDEKGIKTSLGLPDSASPWFDIDPDEKGIKTISLLTPIGWFSRLTLTLMKKGLRQEIV